MTKCLLLTAFLATALGLKMNNPNGPGSTHLNKEHGYAPLPEAEVIQEKLLESTVVDGKSVVQNLVSDGGMAYYGALFVGGQEQVSIYDTGSFDVVVESKCVSHDHKTPLHHFMKTMHQNGTMGEVAVSVCCSASKCPHAKYSSHLSGTNFKAAANKAVEEIDYGSGPVWVKSGTDHMSLSDQTKRSTIAKSSVPVSVIVDHKIELFKYSDMTAIVGVGPGDFKDRKQRMVYHMGIKRFMVCFQEDQRKTGLWTWNDKDRSADAKWLKVPVPASEFWGLPVSHFQMDKKTVGCVPHCGAIIDTGTSLLTFPSAIVRAISMKIQDAGIKDCSDLSKFPDFEFKLGDHKFSLPPSAYLADAGVQQTQGFHQQLAFAPLPMTARDLSTVESAKRDGLQVPSVHSCIMMVSAGDYGNVHLEATGDKSVNLEAEASGDKSEQTQYGKMVIFGMSLFRKYAIQFDLSGDIEGKEGTRAMRFAEASPDCTGPVQAPEFSRQARTLHKVNLDKLRISPLQQRLAPHSDVMGSQLFRKGVLRI